MGLGGFLRQTAGAIGGGINFLNKNPIANTLISQIPGANAVLKTLQPIASVAKAAFGGKAPSWDQAADAVRSGREVMSAGRDLYRQNRGAAEKLGGQLGAIKNSVKRGNYEEAGRGAMNLGQAGYNMYKQVKRVRMV